MDEDLSRRYLKSDDVTWLLANGWEPVVPVRRFGLASRMAAVGAVVVLAFVSGLALPRAYSVRVGSTTQCQGAANTPGGADPWGGCWPGEWNTGVPAGTTLTTYSGPLTITTNGTVIDSKIVNGDLDIDATGVVITNSRIFGEVNTGEGEGDSVSVTDSEVINTARSFCMCIGPDNVTVLRVEIRGGPRGVYCRSFCNVQDTYIWDVNAVTAQHVSGIRQEQNGTVTHNTIACDYDGETASDAGCSADLGGYPDFAPVHHNTYTRNFFRTDLPTGGSLGFCAYGGATSGKPFSADPTNATYIVFTENVWERGSNNTCGAFGPITDFNGSRTGNSWSGNKFTDGATINP